MTDRNSIIIRMATLKQTKRQSRRGSCLELYREHLLRQKCKTRSSISCCPLHFMICKYLVGFFHSFDQSSLDLWKLPHLLVRKPSSQLCVYYQKLFILVYSFLSRGLKAAKEGRKCLLSSVYVRRSCGRSSLSSLSPSVHNHTTNVSYLAVRLQTSSSPLVFIMAVFPFHVMLAKNSIHISPVLCILCCFSLALDKEANPLAHRPNWSW